MKDDVKKKIRKLLALARKAGTEAEAANAMEKVHKMLLKHNLSLSEVDVRDYDMLVEDMEGGWSMPMWMGVATLYLTKYLISPGQPPKNILIGQPDNIKVVRETIRQLTLICNELVKKYAEQARVTQMPVMNMYGQISMVSIPNLNLEASVESYRRGFAARVHNRCMQEVEKAKRQGATAAPDEADGDTETVIGTALVVRELYEQEAERIASFLSESGMQYEQTPVDIHAPDREAFMNGFEAGGSVALAQKAELQ